MRRIETLEKRLQGANALLNNGPQETQMSDNAGGSSASSDTAYRDTANEMGMLPGRPLLFLESEYAKLYSYYVSSIRPFVPVVHAPTFMKSPDDHRLSVSQAIFAIASKHVYHDGEMINQAAKWRREAMASLSHISLDSVKVLLLLSYDDLCYDDHPKHWGLIAAMGPLAKFLQIDQEEPDADSPLALAPARGWIEVEERKRVFWSVVIFERFSAIWAKTPITFTSDSITRRLPCDGIFWTNSYAISCPFAYGNGGRSGSRKEMAATGGFARVVEVSDIILHVAQFQRQNCNFSDPQTGQRWADTFESYDTILSSWLENLPDGQTKPGFVIDDDHLDENLTLAHLIHCAATIVLYFNPSYTDLRDTLPESLQVLATAKCRSAAAKMESYVRVYLDSTEAPPSPPFTFCVFVGAVAQLLENRENTTLSEALFQMLREIHLQFVRWGKPENVSTFAGNLYQRLLILKYSEDNVNVDWMLGLGLN